MSRIGTIVVVLVALLSLILYDRLPQLALLYANAPGRMKVYSSFKSDKTIFPEKLRNCEDAIRLDGGLVLFSCDEGRNEFNTVMGHFGGTSPPNGKLYLYNYTSATDSKLTELTISGLDSDFRPLGIEYHAQTSTLYAVNHSQKGPRIEIFYLSLRSLDLTHMRTITHPLISAPNAIVSLSLSKLLVTNWSYFLPAKNPWLAVVEKYLALPLGRVIAINLVTDTVDVIARLPFPNGIALINETTLAVASSTYPGIFFYKISLSGGTTPIAPVKVKLQQLRAIKTPAFPDNLSVDANSKLLIAGHPTPQTLNKISANRRLCTSSAGKDQPECSVQAGSWVGEWSEHNGLKDLFWSMEFMSSATAVRDVKSGMGFVAGLYSDGVLVWEE